MDLIRRSKHHKLLNREELVGAPSLRHSPTESGRVYFVRATLSPIS